MSSIRVLRTKADRDFVCQIIQSAPEGCRVEIREPRRTDAQNDKMHAMIRDVWRQVPRMDLGGRKFSEQDWKRVFSASLAGEMRMALGLDDQSIILLPHKTSEQGVKWISDMIESIYAYGAKHEVVWTDTDKWEVR